MIKGCLITNKNAAISVKKDRLQLDFNWSLQKQFISGINQGMILMSMTIDHQTTDNSKNTMDIMSIASDRNDKQL